MIEIVEIISIPGKYSIKKLPSDILKHTAKNEAVIRKQKNWIQVDLASYSDVSYGSIKRFKRSGKISFESLLKIAETFNRLDKFETIVIASNKNRLESYSIQCHETNR